MKRWQRPTIAVLGLLLLLLSATPATVGAQAQSLTLNLAAQNNSGISGTATLTDLGGGKTRVAIQVDGAGAGPEPAHIHPGSCAQLVPTPAFTLTNVTNGSSTTDVDSSLDQLMAQPFAVHMHKSFDELTVYVACADIVQGQNRPGTLPRSGGGPGDDPIPTYAIVAGLALLGAGFFLGLRRSSRPTR
ncbi:MAG: hypothetical protein JOZ65_26105 [Chloroflexi bacterium]|nr:hypothetical protein [Chloroflexota bacterium]